MAAKKTSTGKKAEKSATAQAGEKIYTIPLRLAFEKSRGKRAPYAMRLIKDFLHTHTKAEDIKIGTQLNHKVWERSIEKPPRRVRVKVVQQGKMVTAELLGFDYQEFKATKREEKKDLREKLMSRLGGKAAQKEALEKTIEGKIEEPAKEQGTVEEAKK